MADNYVTSVGTGGSTFASDDISSVQYPRVKTSWGVDGVAVDTSATNPLPTSINASIFRFSTNNTSVAQLAAGATFTGTIETALDQPSISILLVSDQPMLLTIKQYIDLAGTSAVQDIVYLIPAREGFSRSFPLNGNYVNVSARNTGLATTTTFSLNTAYGSLPSADRQGNAPVVVSGSAEFNGTSILESCITGDLALSTQTINPERRDSSGARIPSDSPSVIRLLATTVGQQFLIDTQGYQSIGFTMGTMSGNFSGSNDTAGTFTGINCTVVAFNNVLVNGLTAGSSYLAPCLTRFVKLTVTTAGWASYTLRQIPVPILYGGTSFTNIGQYLGVTAASTNPIHTTPLALAATNNQTLHSNIITATAAAVGQLKASAGRLTMLNMQNNSANIAFLHLQNNAAATTATVAVQTYVIPPSIGATVDVSLPDGGLFLSAGIAYTVSSLITSGDATALTAPSLVINASFI